MTEKQFKEELRRECDAVVERVYDAFNQLSEDGVWVSNDKQRIVLELPEAYFYLARFLACVDDRHPQSLASWQYIESEDAERKARRFSHRIGRDLLQDVLVSAMHERLEMLADHYLPFMSIAEDLLTLEEHEELTRSQI